jgi:hypothetical protein
MLLLVLLCVVWSPVSAAKDDKDGSFIPGEDKDNNLDGVSSTTPTSLRRRKLHQGKRLATFQGRRLAGCESGRVSSSRGPPPPRTPEPPPRIPKDRRRRRLRDRISLIDGFQEGDEADVVVRSGSSIHDSKNGRGGNGRGGRGGDDDDDSGGDGSSSGGGGGGSGNEEGTEQEQPEQGGTEEGGAEEETNEEGTDEEEVDTEEGIDCEDEPNGPESGGVIEDTPKTYIIRYRDDMSDQAMISIANTVEFEVESSGGQIEQVYTEVLNGMAATLTKDSVEELLKNPGVESVVEDTIVFIDDATWGIDRIDQATGRNNAYRWQGNTNAGDGVNVCVSELNVLLG